MTVATHKQSPLVAFADEDRPVDDATGIEIVEYPFQGYHNLRCDASNPEVTARLTNVLGVGVPHTPNRFAKGDSVIVYWLGPDEWLLRTPSESDRSLIEALASGLEGVFHALTDLCSGITHIRVSGEKAEDVLRQGTPLDLHPRVFGDGHCAQTVMAKTNVLLARSAGADKGFDVFLRRSFADHLMLFLGDAAHDVGFRFRRSVVGSE